MSDKNLVSMGSKSFEDLKQVFEDLKQVNEYGAEYWSAREIQPLLGYTQWRRFEDAIKRAITSCKQSGNEPSHHFAGAGKPIEGGKGLELRKQTAEEFKALSGAARDAGVHDRMFGVFHDAGYKGMYGGLGRDAKGLIGKMK